MDYLTLSNGIKLPMVGFGTHLLKGEGMNVAIKAAYDSGYILFDTAWLYKNESDLATALTIADIKRESVILESKISVLQIFNKLYRLGIRLHSEQSCIKGTLSRLDTPYIDLYLIHSPYKGVVKTYTRLQQMRTAGIIKTIGVCNFDIEHLESIKKSCGEYPSVNQIEIHPFRQQNEIVDFCQRNGVIVEGYSPFGRGAVLKELLTNEIIIEIAVNHKKTITQIIIRWLIQRGIIALPRSSSPIHIAENIDVFDFELSDEEMIKISSLNRNQHYGKEYDNIL